ncbi:HAD family phosphatase [Tetragenococcus halophilus]|uniref:HAD family phosphatase n=1 Tax=Tetragenococcus halophilus TaxID=51669 RepID=A0A3G5FHI5_TETHA|nr:HAD family hydrolase [Tetragenococcus halophilus]AYW49813.1 HAD family phosphatase [Tetragenococcus halophilus]GBD63864.1 hypothetical protein TEHD23766T_1291 [Tetragenococcus halophilus subsp. flandriensis]GFK21373.1 haloacid dehalogenase [Tetragenococcus halophilus]
MKLLISDFDGTLYQNNTIEDHVLQKIEKWQREGNYFIVATGRDYLSIIEKIKAYNIFPDFIIGNNGATINNAIVTSLKKEIYPSLISRIMRNVNIIENIKISYIIEDKIASKKFVFNELNKQKINSFFQKNKLMQISLKTISIYSAFEFIKENTAIFSDVRFLNNIETVDIVDCSVNKLVAIEMLNKRLGISTENTFTIGDGLNDLQMLTNYKSATFPWAQSSLKEESNYQVCDIGDFITQIS